MLVASLSWEEWVALSVDHRDSVRVGFLNRRMPERACPWPETEWGWKILLGRMLAVRVVAETWCDQAVPATSAEHDAVAAHTRWLKQKRQDTDFYYDPPEIPVTRKKPLTRLITAVKHVLASVSVPLRRALGELPPFYPRA